MYSDQNNNQRQVQINLLEQAQNHNKGEANESGAGAGAFVPPFKKFTIDEDKEVKTIQVSNITVATKSSLKQDKKSKSKYQQPAVAKGKPMEDSSKF